MAFDPQQTYILLAADGTAAQFPGGEEFWQLPESEIAHLGAGWLVSEYLFDTDWPSWEMHPEADEFVYLLAGEADLLLEHANGVQIVPLSGRGAVVVPRGIWHTAKVMTPSRMLHITRGEGTQTRPV